MITPMGELRQLLGLEFLDLTGTGLTILIYP